MKKPTKREAKRAVKRGAPSRIMARRAKMPTVSWRADVAEHRTQDGELVGATRGRQSVAISVTSSELVEMLRKLAMLDGLEICHGTERIQFVRMDFKHLGE